MKYKVHSINEREKQFEIFYDLLDDKGVVVAGNQTLMTPREPDGKEVDAIMEGCITDFQTPPEEPEVEKVYSAAEIEDGLSQFETFGDADFLVWLSNINLNLGGK